MVTFTDDFAEFVVEAEPRLRRALIAVWGSELGREATVDALVYGWLNWDRVRNMANPIGYLYRVGRNSVRPRKPVPVFEDQVTFQDPWVEPELEKSLRGLSEPQRVAVTLHHCFEWTYEEIADLLDVAVSTVRNHLNRGMRKLRVALGVSVDA